MTAIDFKNYFFVAEYCLKKKKIFYYSISDNYKLDEFCIKYYNKFKSNPYFVNKWYSMDLFHIYFFKEIRDNFFFSRSEILELGGGLGISANVFASAGFKIYCIDREFYSCKLINESKKLNSLPSINSVNCDWNTPPFKKKFDIIIGIDIIYEKENVEPLYNCVRNFLSEKGFFYLANFSNYALGMLKKKMSKEFKIEKELKKNKSGHQLEIFKFIR